MSIDLKSIQDSIKKLEKKHGKGVVINMDKSRVGGVKFQPTGIFSFDDILGGGLPEGGVVELYGQESSGKTSLAISIAKSFQDAGKAVAFLDLEHAFNPKYAKELGLDISQEKFLFSQPDWGEQALDIIDVWVQAGVKLIVVDSVANMVPKEELEGNAGDAVVAKVARLMSQAMRRLSGVVSKNKSCILFINQIRQNIGGGPYGNPNVTPGGNALKFWASIRVQVARKAKLKAPNGNDYLGIKILAKTVKNKVATPFQEAEFDLIFGQGIQVDADMFDLCVKRKIIEVSGRTYTYQGITLGSSKGSAIESLEKGIELKERIKKSLYDSYKGGEEEKEVERLSKEAEHPPQQHSKEKEEPLNSRRRDTPEVEEK